MFCIGSEFLACCAINIEKLLIADNNGSWRNECILH